MYWGARWRSDTDMKCNRDFFESCDSQYSKSILKEDMDEISPEEEKIRNVSRKVYGYMEGRDGTGSEEREELLNLLSVCQEEVTSLTDAKQQLRESELDALCVREKLAASEHADKVLEKSKSQLSDEISALVAQTSTLECSERRKREKVGAQ